MERCTRRSGMHERCGHGKGHPSHGGGARSGGGSRLMSGEDGMAHPTTCPDRLEGTGRRSRGRCMLHGCCRVGVHLPSVEVRFEGLEVSGQCYAAGRELPSIWNAYRNWFEVGQATALIPLSNRSAGPDHSVQMVSLP